MDKTIKIILIISILSAAGLILYFAKFNNKSSIAKNNEVNKKTYTEYYVPVTNYWSGKEDISINELKNKNIIIELGEKDNLKEILGDVILENQEKSLKDIELVAKEEIAIIKWDSVTPNLKTLSVDKLYLWSQEQDNNYLLKKKIETDKNIKDINEFNPLNITRIVAGGDVMLSRHVSTKIKSLGELAPWKKISDFFKQADISFLNLEVPLSDRYPTPSSGMSFIAPTEYANGLIFSGIDIVSVANNHSANFGQKVFEDNLDTLKTNNILACGGGMNDVEARTPKIIEKNGIKFSFLCYNAITGGLAADSDSGTAFLSIEPWYRDNEANIKKLEEDIKSAKKISDVVIVSPHWGVEYKLAPNSSQQKVAKRMIDAGADLIIGTHPHVVQASEYYKGKYITYSLGNLIFDQEWSQETKQGIILENYFYKNKQVSANIIPIQIKDYHEPNFTLFDLSRLIIEKIKSVSTGF